MVTELNTDAFRINARKSDAFDIFNIKHYIGPNPFLNTSALVFDFSLTGFLEPQPLEIYVSAISKRYPHLGYETYESYAQLFAKTVSEVGNLDMGLHLNRWSLKPYKNHVKISIQSLHARTKRSVIYAVWDWFEAITQGEEFLLDSQIKTLQEMFRRSVYGGPTVYALFRTAYEKDIPAFYLWEEGLMQYGYGKKQIRGIATTFNGDSHLDSDFTTRKDDCKAFLNTLGFPVPQGSIVSSQNKALSAAEELVILWRLNPSVVIKALVSRRMSKPRRTKICL
jgi:cyanophycin synthetase